MFTGLIEVGGVVEAYEKRAFGARLRITITGNEPFKDGESVAVNGVCLTVLPDHDRSIAFDVSDETIARTALGRLQSGSRVNIERSLALGDRLGGHMVQG